MENAHCVGQPVDKKIFGRQVVYVFNTYVSVRFLICYDFDDIFIQQTPWFTLCFHSRGLALAWWLAITTCSAFIVVSIFGLVHI